MKMSKKPITAIIVGAGHRGILYASYALHYPDQLKIVGVADLNPHKRAKAAEMFGFGEDMCLKRPRNWQPGQSWLMQS